MVTCSICGCCEIVGRSEGWTDGDGREMVIGVPTEIFALIREGNNELVLCERCYTKCGDLVQISSACVHLEFALEYIHCRRFISAKESARKSLELQETSGAWHAYGLAIEELGDTFDALRCYKKALAIDPGYLPARLNLSRIINDAPVVEEMAPYQPQRNGSDNEPHSK